MFEISSKVGQSKRGEGDTDNKENLDNCGDFTVPFSLFCVYLTIFIRKI